MGLLDVFNSYEGQQALGLLAAAGGRSDGAGFGQRLMEGLSQGDKWKAAQAAEKRAQMQEQMQQMQMQQMANQAKQQEAEMARRRTIEQGMGQFFKSGQPALSPLAGNSELGILQSAGRPAIPPSFDAGGAAQFLAQNGEYDKALPLLQSLQPKERTLSPGQVVYQGTKKILEVPKETDRLDPNKPFYLDKDGRVVPNEAYQSYDLRAKAASAPRSTTTIDMKGDTEYAKDQGKQYSELMATINKAGFAAPSQLRKLERMTQLLDGVEGGKLAPMGTEVASALNSFGIKVDPKLGNKEASLALSREFAGGLRQPGTGPMTDKDFDNFLLQIPDLSKSAQGRKQITETMQRALARDIEVSKRAREYERRTGRIDGGFMDEVSRYIAENPVIALPQGYGVQR